MGQDGEVLLRLRAEVEQLVRGRLSALRAAHGPGCVAPAALSSLQTITPAEDPWVCAHRCATSCDTCPQRRKLQQEQEEHARTRKRLKLAEERRLDIARLVSEPWASP